MRLRMTLENAILGFVILPRYVRLIRGDYHAKNVRSQAEARLSPKLWMTNGITRMGST